MSRLLPVVAALSVFSVASSACSSSGGAKTGGDSGVHDDSGFDAKSVTDSKATADAKSGTKDARSGHSDATGGQMDAGGTMDAEGTMDTGAAKDAGSPVDASGAPTSPTGVTVTLYGVTARGLLNTNTAPEPDNTASGNTIAIAWTQGAGGMGGLAKNKVYRSVNGGAYSLYATLSPATTTYTDSAATDCIGSTYATGGSGTTGTKPPYWQQGVNSYNYKVTVIDGESNESPQSDPMNLWIYHGLPGATNNGMNWGGDFSAGVTVNYGDKTHPAVSGGTDIEVTVTSQYGLYQPYCGGICNLYALPALVFNYLEFDMLSPNTGGTGGGYNGACEVRTGPASDGEYTLLTASGQSNNFTLSDYVVSPTAKTFTAGVFNHVKMPLANILEDYASAPYNTNTTSVDGTSTIQRTMYKWRLQDQQNPFTSGMYSYYMRDIQLTQ